MKKKFTGLTALLLLITGSIIAQDIWTEKAVFRGGGRQDAVGFSIGDKGYMGTGTDETGAYKNDFWEYDPATDTWTQKADFAGGARCLATGIGIGSRGYIGFGKKDMLCNDFWEYDPATNAWAQKANFAGTARLGATGFAVGSKGYIGTGKDSTGFLNDFWEYDQLSDSWNRKPDLPGPPRCSAVGFSIGLKGYLGTGYKTFDPPYQTIGIWMSDFFEYDPAVDKWTLITGSVGQVRSSAIGFSIGNRGYFGTGQTYVGMLSDFWEYYPEVNTWVKKSGYQANTRMGAVAFGIGNKGYVVGGFDGNNFARRNDVLEYSPVDEHLVKSVNFDPIVVTTVAGSGAAGFADGNSSTAKFNNPTGITGPDANGFLYVADKFNSCIRRIAPNGDVSNFAGTGIAGYHDGPGISAQFCSPSSIAMDAAGNLYVADECNHAIRKITRAGIVSTFSGNGTAGKQDGNSAAARFNTPRGVAVDAAGNVYVADALNHQIRKITAGGDVTTFAGNGGQGIFDGAPGSALFNTPLNLAFGPAGYLYVTEENGPIRRISPGGFVSSVNPPDFPGFKQGLAIDKNGTINTSVVIDGMHNAVYKIMPSRRTVLLAGTTNGYSDGVTNSAQFSFPAGLAVDSAGNIYVADAGNNCIRKISKPSPHFMAEAGSPSTTQVFIVSANNSEDDTVRLEASEGFEFSLSGNLNGPWSSSTVISYSELVSLQTIVRMKANTIAGTYTGNLTLSGLGAENSVMKLTGTVIDTTPPVMATPPKLQYCAIDNKYYVVYSVTAFDDAGIASQGFAITGATNRSGTGGNPSGYFNPGMNYISYTAIDVNGNRSVCSTTVRIDQPLTAAIPDVYPLLFWGQPNTLYIGFGPASLTLTAMPSGGTRLPGGNYSYAWSNGGTSKSISVHAATAGSYNYSVTITDSLGCQYYITKRINVVDVRCGNKMNKVLVCWPSRYGNIESCVNDKQALLALLFGARPGSCGNGTQRSIEPDVTEAEKGVSIFPNPNNGSFVIQLSKLNDVEVRVLDQSGRVISRQIVNGGNNVQRLIMNLGRLANGLYLVEAVSKEGVYTAKMLVQQ